MLTDRAKALLPNVQAAFDAGGLDAVCEFIAAVIAPLQVRVAELSSAQRPHGISRDVGFHKRIQRFDEMG